METRLIFLIILLLCIWLLVSNKGKKLIMNFRNNIQNMIAGNPTRANEVETDG